MYSYRWWSGNAFRDAAWLLRRVGLASVGTTAMASGLREGALKANLGSRIGTCRFYLFSNPELDGVGTRLVVSRSGLDRSPVGHEYDFACHPSFAEQLVGFSSLDKRKSLRDQWLYLLLLKEIKQGDQILSEQGRFKALEPLDAVRNHPFPTREKPVASDAPPEDRGFAKTMATTGLARCQSAPT